MSFDSLSLCLDLSLIPLLLSIDSLCSRARNDEVKGAKGDNTQQGQKKNEVALTPFPSLHMKGELQSIDTQY